VLGRHSAVIDVLRKPVVHGTSGSTSYETIPHVRLETSGGVLSTVDMVVQRRDGPCLLRELNNDDDAEASNKLPLPPGGIQAPA